MSRVKTAKFSLKRHDLGDASPGALLREADIASAHLLAAKKALVSRDLALATDHFFKAAAIAVNVAFTSRTHEIRIPDDVMSRMEETCEEASGGIYRIMRLVAARKLAKHVRRMHPSGSAKKAVLVKTNHPVDLWFRMTKKGIPLNDLRVLPAGIAVTGHSVDDIREVIGN